MLPETPRCFRNKNMRYFMRILPVMGEKTMKQIKFTSKLNKFSWPIHKTKATKVSAANSNNTSVHTVSTKLKS